MIKIFKKLNLLDIKELLELYVLVLMNANY